MVIRAAKKIKQGWYGWGDSLWEMIREDFHELAMWKSGRKIFHSDRFWLQRPRLGITLVYLRGKMSVIYTKLYSQMPWHGLYKRKSKQTELSIYFKTNLWLFLNVLIISTYVKNHELLWKINFLPRISLKKYF